MKLSIFKNRDFSLVMCGKLVSLLGTQMQAWALSYYVIHTTKDTGLFSLVIALTFIPQILLQPIAGVIVDRFDRKKIIVGLDLFSGLLVGVFAFLFIVNDGLGITSICIMVMLMAAISSFFQPAIITTIPLIVKKEDLITANTTNSFIMSAGMAIAPTLAGMIFGRFGLLIVMILNSVSFILSAVSEMFINIPYVAHGNEKFSISEFKQDFMGGLRFVLSSRTMIAIIGIAFALNFVGDSIMDTGAASLLELILQVPVEQQGLIKTISFASMMVAPFVCNLMSKRMNLKKVLYVAVITIGFFMVAFAGIGLFSEKTKGSYMLPYIAIAVVLFFLKMLEVVGSIALSTACQQEAPREMLGRVGTLMNTAIVASAPVGLVIFGYLYKLMPMYIGFGIAAAILLITTFSMRPLISSKKEGQATNEAAAGRMGE